MTATTKDVNCPERGCMGRGLALGDPIVIPAQIAGSALCHCRLAQRVCASGTRGNARVQCKSNEGLTYFSAMA